jgi:streptogrisin C
MNRMTAVRSAGAVLLAVGLAATFSVPASAAEADATSATNTQSVTSEILSAMNRDLGLDEAQARTLLARQAEAADAEARMKTALGDTFGGAWFDQKTMTLTVGVTDAAKLAEVATSGVNATVVRHSAADLDAMMDRLNAVTTVPAGVLSWGVDTIGNDIVITTKPGAVAPAKAFAASAGVTNVRVHESAEAMQPFYNVQGGDAYYINSSARCSIGFAVSGGFVSAGHCGSVGNSTTGYNQVSQGTFRGSSFPGNDYSWVAVNSNWTPTSTVTGIGRITGSTEAATGSSVCKSGSTTGVTCGTVGSKNQTVTYPQGTVRGMTATNVRCQAGDSGGGFVSGSQAQGMVSGGNSSVCYFFPVRGPLNAYGLRLVTG